MKPSELTPLALLLAATLMVPLGITAQDSPGTILATNGITDAANDVTAGFENVVDNHGFVDILGADAVLYEGNQVDFTLRLGGPIEDGFLFDEPADNSTENVTRVTQMQFLMLLDTGEDTAGNQWDTVFICRVNDTVPLSCESNKRSAYRSTTEPPGENDPFVISNSSANNTLFVRAQLDPTKDLRLEEVGGIATRIQVGGANLSRMNTWDFTDNALPDPGNNLGQNQFNAAGQGTPFYKQPIFIGGAFIVVILGSVYFRHREDGKKPPTATKSDDGAPGAPGSGESESRRD